MKFLGIDYGAKRIGLALSDERGTLAFPKEIIKNDRNSIGKVIDIMKKEGISEVVIGESKDLAGNKNTIMPEAERFGTNISAKNDVKVHWEKEFWSSIEARKFKPKAGGFRSTMVGGKVPKPDTKHIDDSAAAIILQRFLDKRNTQSGKK